MRIFKLLEVIILLFALGVVCYYHEDVTTYIIENYIYYDKNFHIDNPNEYRLNYNFEYVNEIQDFKISNKKQLINTLYTILNNGTDSFNFYCDYDACENDVNTIANDDTLSIVNNFVHPYNSYKKVFLSINSRRKVEVIFQKTYTDSEIVQVENKMNEIISTIINDNMTDKEKIIAFHDYIIQNTKYDLSYINNNLEDINSQSHKATGILFNNTGLCGGYSDVMNIFLNKLNIKNYLISSEYHVWNAVYLDNNWYHLDLTWDDPITSNGSDIKLEKFLLITDKQLSSYNTGYHNYNKNIYSEFNFSEG